MAKPLTIIEITCLVLCHCHKVYRSGSLVQVRAIPSSVPHEQLQIDNKLGKWSPSMVELNCSQAEAFSVVQSWLGSALVGPSLTFYFPP